MSLSRDTTLRDCILSSDATLRDAMLTLERNALGIVLVADPERTLRGILTDGDIRRAMLAGAGLDSSVGRHMQREFAAVEQQTDRAAVLDLMRARSIQQIPIVDRAGRVCGLHLLREFIAARRRENWAVVMAGGEGKRLRPLTESVPKPMLRVAGRPILERIVLQIVGAGIRRIFLAVNYMAATVEEHFGNGDRFGCDIEYLREQQPLGTAGALGLLPALPAAPLLLMNGDLVTQANLDRLLDFHEHGSAAATVGVHRYLHTVPFGCVRLENGRVHGLEEKPTIAQLVNSGIYVLSPRLVAAVPQRERSDITDLLNGALKSGSLVTGLEIGDDWIDVGQFEQLEIAVHGS